MRRLAVLLLLVGTAASLHAEAQDALVAALFPGVELSAQPTLTGELFVGTYAEIESSGKDYVALAYYQPYRPELRNRYLSYALLERVGDKYAVRLDHVAADDAAGVEIGIPFFYRVAGAELVVFSTCYRGCRYTFFRLGTPPLEIPLERYTGFRAGESFNGRVDAYRFDEAGLFATFSANGRLLVLPKRRNVGDRLHAAERQIRNIRSPQKELAEPATVNGSARCPSRSPCRSTRASRPRARASTSPCT